MPLGMKVGLSPGDFVLGTQHPTPKGAEPHPIFRPRLLWPNGCMDQDATWYGGRPRPTRHCVRYVPSYPQKKGHTHPTQFLDHVYCGQMAAWIKMPLGMEVGLGPGHIVLDGDPAPLPKNAHIPPTHQFLGPCLLWPNGWMDQNGTWYDGRPRPGQHCVRYGPSSTPRGITPQISAHGCCGQMAGWMKMALGTMVGLGRAT